jgi:hypothetical protein
MEGIILLCVVAFFLLYTSGPSTTGKGLIVPQTGIPQGGCCTFDFQCAGWSFFGDIACCDSVCITKDYTLQTCRMACALDPGGTCNSNNKC